MQSMSPPLPRRLHRARDYHRIGRRVFQGVLQLSARQRTGRRVRQVPWHPAHEPSHRATILQTNRESSQVYDDDDDDEDASDLNPKPYTELSEERTSPKQRRKKARHKRPSRQHDFGISVHAACHSRIFLMRVGMIFTSLIHPTKRRYDGEAHGA